MTQRVYLDWNATAPLRPEARDAMIAAMDVIGNPSSVHSEGRAAKSIVEKARGQVAGLVGCAPSEVVFTSGATEAVSVLDASARHGVDVFVDETAHDALWAYKSMSHWTSESHGHSWAFGMASGETGIIGTPPDLSDGQYEYAPGVTAAWLLLDICQLLGRVPFSFSKQTAQFAIASAHKLGGPKGVGCLIVRSGNDVSPLLKGGGQEMGRRSGTENVIGIAGFGAAAEAAQRDLANGAWDRVARMRDSMETMIMDAAPEAIVFGKDDPRLPNTANFAVSGWKGETQVMQMDLAGFAVSAGSACSSGKVKESRVLRAMGFDSLTASSAIRVSMGPTTTPAEVTAFADTWIDYYRRFKARAA